MNVSRPKRAKQIEADTDNEGHVLLVLALALALALALVVGVHCGGMSWAGMPHAKCPWGHTIKRCQDHYTQVVKGLHSWREVLARLLLHE